MRFSHISLGALALAMATPAMADTKPIDPVASDTPAADAPSTTTDDAPAPAPAPAEDVDKAPKTITITGGTTLTSDYRFRGLTQSNEKPVFQATININHKSGFYIGTWASEIDGGVDGSTPALTGYGFGEVDLYAGFTKTLNSGVGFDAGLLYYLYPDRASGLKTDFFEPYASINYTIGPVNAKVGATYAWGGQAGLNFTPGKDDNIYVYGELSGAIPTTPVTLKAHLGYTDGSLGLVSPTFADDNYWDWSLTAEFVGGPVKFGVSYIDTDITEKKALWAKGSGSTLKVANARFAQFYGRGGTLLAYVGFSF